MPPFYAAPRAALGQHPAAPTLPLPLSQIKRRTDLHHKRCCRFDRDAAVSSIGVSLARRRVLDAARGEEERGPLPMGGSPERP